MMTDTAAGPDSQEPTKTPETPTIPKLTVIDIGSGVSVCDLPYDHSEYDRLVEEFRR